jgi:hypothetical protein
MRDLRQLFDPREFNLDGYKIILEVTDDEAMALHRALRYGDREHYSKLDAELRAKFEKHFRVEFD